MASALLSRTLSAAGHLPASKTGAGQVKRALSSSKVCFAAPASDRSSHYMKMGRFVKIHYEKVGNGEHKVLLLPGALGSTKTDFDPQLDKLDRAKFTLIALDPPGYGLSRPPDREWSDKFLHNDALVAAQFMKTLGYERYSIVGWSDGGNSGMILAAMYPRVVRKLVVWGSNSFITPEELAMYQSIADIDKWSEKMRAGFVSVYGEEYFRKHWKLWIDTTENYYNQNNGNLFQESLPLIKCPTLIIHGDKDAMVPVLHALYLQKHIVNSKLIRWPDGKHNLHLRYADEFNAEVEKFLVEQG